MAIGIVLIHGYTGGAESLHPLYEKLSSIYGIDSVANITLPGHDSIKISEFNREAFVGHISDTAMAFRKQGRDLIIIGHSTGGVLAVDSIVKGLITPSLLILASAPKRLDSGAWDRWIRHRSGKPPVPFIDIAKMASFINSTGRIKLTGDFSVLVMNGDSDELVLPVEAFEWGKQCLTGNERTVIIPGAGHDLFQGTGSAFAIDIVIRAVFDAGHRDQSVIEGLKRVEHEASGFLTASPASGYHIAHCPSGQRLMNRVPVLESFSVNEPVFANIEITTRCSMGCKYCARSFLKKEGRDMSTENFSRIIGLLPHAYRITLVGLGEPLLHPDIVDIVAIASSHGRRVGLVTNAMHLDEALSERLVRAGIRSIAFSLDAPTQESASDIRPGTDLERVINNIRSFGIISKDQPQIAKAVFSAISIETAPFLVDLVDLVSGLGVNVMMLTDLNYKHNLKNSLWQSADDGIKQALHRAMRHAFRKKLPVLSVHALEEFGLADRYRDFLLIPPNQLGSRSERRTWCLSPWQTMPVDVDGNVTVCDCQPEKVLGNLLNQPISEIWNGKQMADHRGQMLGSDPPEACRICPRF
jgi:MoaA/NifB/PqqE/SkfB family radical SAM enzyme